MPERGPSINPLNIVGSTLVSGDVNTGQQCMTVGGTRTFTKLSGTAGGTALIWTGAGRLDGIHLHPGAGVTMPTASGIAQQFWDQSAVVSGMNGSGTTLANVHPGLFAGNAATLLNLNSGQLFYGGFQQLGYTFRSGLAFNSTSGQTGFTVSYTPTFSG